ncbi:MAG: L-glutamate gamma-semialdehyde dehydrogenase, partial [Deinococcus-Thermus bacterium]|nr:L-glutamate gamma-semialdehyde dehydrogenase [Deinococcota bacterium]
MFDPFEPYVNEPYSNFADPKIRDGFRATLEAVRGRLGDDWPLIVDGEAVTTGAWIESYDPCRTDRLVGRA